MRSQLEASLERTQLLERQVEEGEEERRRMHNTILDLAGSVRVYVRARPFLKSDGEGAAEDVGGCCPRFSRACAFRSLRSCTAIC